MTQTIRPFKKPIYVTRPLLPDLDVFKRQLEHVWESQWLTNNGHQHQLLEQRIVETLRVPHASLFNNGTIALITACQALGLTGEVITTPFTFAATPHVLAWNNLTPVFCDIDPVTMNIDPSKIEALITPRTSAILAVHVFGHPCDVAAIETIAHRHKLKVIYDAAHAFGAELTVTDETSKKLPTKKGIGTFGDITMFSFHATKLFHSGEGGALTFNDPNLKPYIDLLKNFGIKNEDEVILPGINGKMNEIQAALGLVVLDEVQAERRRRQKILARYHHWLTGVPGIEFTKVPSSVTPSYQYFVIRINKQKFGKSRDEVHSEFKNYNIITRKYFYPLCSQYDCYRDLPSASPAQLPVANTIGQQVLSMPFYGGLSLKSVDKICQILLNLR